MSDDGRIPVRQVRAVFDDDAIVVYQAYGPEIADPALAAGTFVPPFKIDRMTWIKPSFLWMMYRCGWATKPGQEHVLAVRMTRVGFEWALAHSSLSHFDSSVYATDLEWAERKRASPVRVQWDPERSLRFEPMGHRSIQIGLGGESVSRYVSEWIVGIEDVTPIARELHRLIDADDGARIDALLPMERPYPLSAELARGIGATEA